MTDSETPNSNAGEERKDQENPEAFARFLGLLAPDPEDAGRLYTRLHGKLVNFFNLKGISDPIAAADETLDRAAAKIAAGAIVPDVNYYCLGIARNIAKEKFRSERREQSVFQTFLENLADNSDELVERIYRSLKPCFEELGVADRELLVEYCQVLHGHARAEHRRQLAERKQTTVLALRVRVTRLRATLADCVRRHATSNGG